VAKAGRGAEGISASKATSLASNKRDDPMTRRLLFLLPGDRVLKSLALLLWLICLLSIIGWAIFLHLNRFITYSRKFPEPYNFYLIWLVYGIVGLLILLYRPRHAIGWIFLFVGLMTPHIVRKFTGSHQFRVTLGSIFVGGIMLVVCDTIARSVMPVGELPVGVITSILGGPFFLILLITDKRF